VEQNRRPRYESTYFLTKVPKTYNGEKTASSKNVLGKVDISLPKSETRSIFVTLY
jgi:hypothetical protein